MIRNAGIFALIVSLIFTIVSCGKDSTGTKDTELPIVSIVTPWDETTRDGEIDVIVSADDNDEIERVELYIAGGLHGTDTKDPYEFTWDMEALADEAQTSIYAVAFDVSKNKGESTPVTVTRGANAAPSATISDATLNYNETTILQDEFITLSGTANDQEDGELGVGNISWSSHLQGTLEPNENNEFTGLAIGDHIITMTATDLDGVTGTATFKVTVEDNPNNDYAYIPAGTYFIGEPAFKKSKVILTRSFWVAKTEMTVKELAQAQQLILGDKFVTDFIDKRNKDLAGTSSKPGLYPAVYGYDPEIDGKNPNYDNLIYKDHPAIFLKYKEVIDICNALSDRDGLTPAYDVQKKVIIFMKGTNGWRLPTEAEWEVAARSGLRGKKFPWGDDSPVGLCNSMSEPTLHNPIDLYNGKGPVPVKSYPPNLFGIYDMAGNVAEMCSDMFPKIGGGVPVGVDPVVVSQEKQPRYVVKGGTWYGFGEEQQISMRRLTIPYNDRDKDGYNSGFGLRIVRNVE